MTMDTDPERNKVDAIYELREAVEIKAQAEHELAANGTQAARDALLVAQLDVEAKTQDAIDVCHECGAAHAADAEHEPTSRVRERRDNVILVDFSRGKASGPQR